MTEDQQWYGQGPVEPGPGESTSSQWQGGDPAGSGPSGGLTDSQLRVLLHRMVADVRPVPDALARIRRAVPRRRARRRNTWTGVAATVLLAAVAIPTIHGVQQLDFPGGPAAVRSDAVSDRTGGTLIVDGGGVTGWPHAPAPASDATAPGAPSTGADAAAASGSPSGAAGTPTASVPLPGCVRTDLGQASSHLSAADSSGKVYGWFTVLNTSGRSCRLTGAGTVLVSAAIGTDPARVKVVDHTTGDPAAALPDPGAANRALVLDPQTGYQVQFGWVPDGSSCPSSPATSGTAPLAGAAVAAPSPAAGAGTGTSPGPAASPAPAPAPAVSPSPTQSGGSPSITLAHTPQSGGPAVATAVVDGACAGTVYRAAPQAVSAAQPSGVSSAG